MGDISHAFRTEEKFVNDEKIKNIFKAVINTCIDNIKNKTIAILSTYTENEVRTNSAWYFRRKQTKPNVAFKVIFPENEKMLNTQIIIYDQYVFFTLYFKNSMEEYYYHEKPNYPTNIREVYKSMKETHKEEETLETEFKTTLISNFKTYGIESEIMTHIMQYFEASKLIHDETLTTLIKTAFEKQGWNISQIGGKRRRKSRRNRKAGKSKRNRKAGKSKRNRKAGKSKRRKSQRKNSRR